ncbi:MAG: hypothetical protein Q4A37_01965 [Candidatus Saccharibacteria bacterium]|nr:hypothetical protein [Candidatus Saccharibacteria bacterium]
MNKVKMMMAGFLAAPLLAVGVTALVPAGDVYAQSGIGSGVSGGLNATKTGGVPENIEGQDGLIAKIVNVLLFVIGIISVIMIIIGGIRYATSNGDANSVTGAKNTILYAVVGLVVAIFAYAIVNFVVTQIK